MRSLFLLLGVFLLLLVPAGSAGAQSYSLKLHRIDGPDQSLAGLLKLNSGYGEQLDALSAVRNLVPQLQEAGYLAASVDSLSVRSDGYDVYLYLGQQWRWARLSLDNLPKALLIATGITAAQYEGRPLNGAGLSRLSERILSWCDDNGFPFARIGLDSLRDDGGRGISANLAFDPGKLLHIDSLVIEGNVRVNKSFMMRYLDLYEGGVYNETRLRQLSARLRELPWLSENSGWHIVFRSIDTKLYLELKERRANILNFIGGLQPNTLETGKFLLTLDGQAAFQNLLGNGETFSFSYQKLQAKSPRIKAEALYPYLFNTPIGAEAHFDLYFKGEEFRRTIFDVGGRYALSAKDYIRLFYKGYSNRVVTPDTAYIIAFRQLPANVDVLSGGGGGELQLNRTDYRFNPRKGWSGRLSGELLSRRIERSDGITGIRDNTGFDYASLYDTIAMNSYQTQVTADLAGYLPLGKRMVLRGNYAGGYISGARLFQNELFQIGGIRLLRGFDEGSLFVNQYHLAGAELRYLLGRNSNVYLFSDNAWLESNINNIRRSGIYNGFGAGALVETSGAQFNIAYALGRSPDNPVQLRQSRVHIGIVFFY
jgi:outer membrane protein assembly factor BamA